MMILVFSGCGRAGREVAELMSEKIDEVNLSKSSEEDAFDHLSINAERDLDWINTYLSRTIPSNIIRSLRYREKPEYDFNLYPYEAQYTGIFTMESGEDSPPIQANISLEKSCAWLFKLDAKMFFETPEHLIQVDVIFQTEELLNSSKSEHEYRETTIIPNHDPDSVEIVDQFIEKYSVSKTTSGLEMDFDSPENRKSMSSDTSVMLYVEAEQHMLDMLKEGVQSYSYKVVDSESDNLYAIEEVEATPHLKSSSGVRLWEVRTRSHRVVNSKNEISIGRQVINSHGVPIYLSLNIDGVDFELLLREVSFPAIEKCDYGMSST